MSTATAKRTNADALADAEAFRALFNPSHYERWEIAGSVRRKCREVGDVEHVVIPRFGPVTSHEGLFAERVTANLLFNQLDQLVRDGTVQKHLYTINHADGTQSFSP